MNTIAVIDIGSNSVRYMEAECTHDCVHSSSKIVNTTRLAEGQDKDYTLTMASMKRTAQAVNEFAELAGTKKIPVYAYATSALREAPNKDDFLSLLNGLAVDILSGEQEGKTAFYGISGQCGTLIDIGGGSFQIANCNIGRSYPIGCVRLTDRTGEEHPDRIYEYLKDWADRVVVDPPEVTDPVTGIGGTITTLAALSLNLKAYDRDLVSGAALSQESLERLLMVLYEMGPDRKEHPLLLKRHSVIIQGGIILKYLMKRFSISSVICSDSDGMEGYARLIFERMKQ